jgi:hypothetical protein
MKECFGKAIGIRPSLPESWWGKGIALYLAQQSIKVQKYDVNKCCTGFGCEWEMSPESFMSLCSKILVAFKVLVEWSVGSLLINKSIALIIAFFN